MAAVTSRPKQAETVDPFYVSEGVHVDPGAARTHFVTDDVANFKHLSVLMVHYLRHLLLSLTFRLNKKEKKAAEIKIISRCQRW